MKNSRFTVATHILAFLVLAEERNPGEPAKSHIMSGSINTNPIVVRRILKQLRDAGLVEVYGGAKGGAKLARRPQDIKLSSVYTAVEDDELFAMHTNLPSQRCPIGSTITPVLTEVYDRVDAAMEDVLGSITINDLYQKMRAVFPEQGLTKD